MEIKSTNTYFRIYICITAFLFAFAFSKKAIGQENPVTKKIVFHGNEVLSEDELIQQMNTREETLIEKMKLWEREPILSDFMLEADIDRLYSFYRRNGFLNPTIKHEVKTTKKNRKATLHIYIRPGNAVIIRNITYSGLKDKKKSEILSEVKESQPIQVGNRFVDKQILNYEASIQKAFYDKGYPFIKINRRLSLDTTENAVDIHFFIHSGEKAYFGETEIEGDSLVSESFIRKQLKYEKGELYSRDKIERTQERLFDTDLFRYVVLRAQKDQVSNDMVPVYIELDELSPWSLEAGAGYGTEDRFRLSARLTKLQFLGGTRKFIFVGKRSHFLPVSLETKFIQPNLLRDNLDLIVNPFFISENEESYKVERLGGGITLQQSFSPSTSGYLVYSLERDFLENKAEVDSITGRRRELTHDKSGITVGMSRNTTNDPFSPEKGWKINGNFTYMGIGFQSKFNYVKGEIEINRYYSIDKDWIIAGKFSSGFIKPFSDDATPIQDRFLIGGASSLRGWGRHQISPVNEEGKPIGGNNMIEGSLELRFPIYDIFSGVGFIDAGNVWREAFDYNLSHLRYDAGFGLRVKTPIGPVRLDLATPVLENNYRLQFFISIGHAF